MESTLKESTPGGCVSRAPDQRIRRAFVLQIRPGAAEEYQRRHDAIWPELVDTLKTHGVHNYSIFRCESSPSLFAYVEIEDLERWQAVGRTEVGQRWRKHMSELLVTHSDCSPVVTPLHEVFHLE